MKEKLMKVSQHRSNRTTAILLSHTSLSTETGAQQTHKWIKTLLRKINTNRYIITQAKIKSNKDKDLTWLSIE